MAWALPVGSAACGEWPQASTRQHLAYLGVRGARSMGWSCEGGTRRVDGPHVAQSVPEVSTQSCASWCEQNFPPAHSIEGQWCCAWTPSPRGPSCSWTDGFPAYGPMPHCDKPQPAALARPAARSSRAQPDESECVEALAYSACALAVETDEPCTPGKRALAVLRADAATDCSESCAAVDGCAYAAYNAEFSTCELHSKCRPANGRSRSGGVDEARGEWEWFAQLPLARSNEPQPQTLHLPTGLAPAEPGRRQRGGRHGSSEEAAVLHASLDTTVPYHCDTSNGKRSADAFKAGGDSPDTCSQICLPNGFWCVLPGLSPHPVVARQKPATPFTWSSACCSPFPPDLSPLT